GDATAPIGRYPATASAAVVRRPAASGGPLGLGQLLAHHLALERAQVVDEQLAVEVVDLVLHAYRQQSVGGQFKGLAVAVQGLHRDLVRALDVGVDSR